MAVSSASTASAAAAAILLTVLVVALCGGGADAGVTPRAIRPRLDGRIVGGRPVNISDFPYQLSFLYNGRHICGASIISEYYVITASHCADGVRPSAVAFRAGSATRGAGGLVLPAESVTTHPLFDFYTIDYDVAVARVAGPFPLGRAGVAAVPLAEAGAAPAPGSPLVVSGWGSLREGGATATQLQAVELQVVEHEACRRAYAPYGGVTSRMLCAAAAGGAGGRDACQGDSGGPLVACGRLVGVVSWGVGCARKGYPGVNADVAALRDWVAEQTGL